MIARERRVDPGTFQCGPATKAVAGWLECSVEGGPEPIVAQVVEPNLVARQGKLLGDAVAHQPGADDRDPLDLGMIHRDALSLSQGRSGRIPRDESGRVPHGRAWIYGLPVETSLPVFRSQRTVRTAM